MADRYLIPPPDDPMSDEDFTDYCAWQDREIEAGRLGPPEEDDRPHGPADDLYWAGLFPVLVFSGGNSPTTAARFPRGEAVHYAGHAISLGVPQDAIIIEPHAANTGQNIDYSRDALAGPGYPSPR